MPDGDTSARNGLLERDCTGRDSYFFDEQAKLCYSEQSKLLGEELARKEKEAQIAYDKQLSDHFAARAQVDSALRQLIFDSDVPVNPDRLIDDLRLLAGCKSEGPELTRLLDFLFVTRRTPLLLEEQEIRNDAPYDLYDEKNRSRFGPLATLASLLAADKSGPKALSHSIALTLSLLATGQKELQSTALVYLAKTLGCPWDALLLARYHLGHDDEVTKMVRDIWEDTVLRRGDDRFGSLKIAISLDSLGPKEVASALLQGVNSSTQPPADPTNLLNAYRSLSLALHESSLLPEEERNKESSSISALLFSILRCFLGWAKLGWASLLIGDVANRAPPGGTDKEICQVVLRCHIELLDAVLASQGMEGKTTREGAFRQLGLKWRCEAARPLTEMSKLKKEEGEQKAVMESICKLAAELGESLRVKEKLEKTEECALLAAHLLPQLLRWAIEGGEGEEMKMEWEGRELTLNLAGASIAVVERVALAAPNEHTEAHHEVTVAEQSTTTIERSKKPNKKKKQKKVEQREERSDAATLADGVNVVSQEESTRSDGSLQLQQEQQVQSGKEQTKGKMQQLREKQQQKAVQQRESSTDVPPPTNNNTDSWRTKGNTDSWRTKGNTDSWRTEGSQQVQSKEFHPAKSPQMGVMQQLRQQQQGQPVMQRHDFTPRGGGKGDWRQGGQQIGDGQYAARPSQGWRRESHGEDATGHQQYQPRPYQSYGRSGGDRISQEYHGVQQYQQLQQMLHQQQMQPLQQSMAPRHNQPYGGAAGESFPPLQPLLQQPPIMKRHSHPFTARGGGDDRGQNAQPNRDSQWARGQPPKAAESPRPVTNHSGTGAEEIKYDPLDYSVHEFTASGLPLVKGPNGFVPVPQISSTWSAQPSSDSAREHREASAAAADSMHSGGREFRGEGRGRGGRGGGGRGGKKRVERN